MENNSGIRKETAKTPVALRRVYVADFQKEGSKTVELGQEVTTTSFYPSKKVSSNLQDGLASPAEFGYAEQAFPNVENRVAWVLVPTAMDDAEIAKRIAADSTNGSCIYRVLSNQPILDENQEYAIEAGLRTKDQFADSQVIRYPENNNTIADGTAGKVVKDGSGKVQYRRTFYSKAPKADIDNRDGNEFLSENLLVELQGASVVTGQSI